MSQRIRIFRAEEPALEVCSWDYSICNLPADEVCELSTRLSKIRDLTKWLRAADKALNCKHLGESLTRAQYENRRLGVAV